MSLVKLQSTKGATIYVNAGSVAIVSPHPTLVTVTNVTFTSGINLEVEGSSRDLALTLGYVGDILSE